MDEFINVSHAFINYISRYIATSCDFRMKGTKSSLFQCSFFIYSFFHCPQLALDLKTEDYFE